MVVLLLLPQVGAASDGRPLLICTTPTKLMAACKHRQQQQQHQEQQQVLEHSGEEIAVVLAETMEDVEDYDKHVFSRLSPLERYGRSAF